MQVWLLRGMSGAGVGRLGIVNPVRRYRARFPRISTQSLRRRVVGTAMPAQLTVASSVRASPELSVHEMLTLSPGLLPLTLKARYGFLATAGPHCACITTLSLSLAVTSLMNRAGTIWPEGSLRNPVSITWFIKTFTSVTPSLLVARIFIGRPMRFLL